MPGTDSIRPHYTVPDISMVRRPEAPASSEHTVSSGHIHVRKREIPIATSFEPPSFHAEDDTLFSTVLFDSIATDTAAIPRFATLEMRDSICEEIIEQARIDSLVRAENLRPSTAEVGITPEPLTPVYSHSTALNALMGGVILAAALVAPSLYRTLRSYRHALFSIRRRRNAFDDSTGISAPMAILLSVVFIVFGGIVLYNVPGLPVPSSFIGAAKAMALLGAYYVFELCAYATVGYAFTGKTGRRQWLAGFGATQAFAGIALIVPALLLVNMPQWHYWLIITSLAIYFIARLVFIIKGCRIFYHNFGSLLYFILYLCTLELLPPAAVLLLMQHLAGASS